MNNNKKTITICSIVALIILAIVVIVTLISDLTGFSIVFGAFFVVLTVCLAIYLREEPDEFNAFIKNKKKILRTYDSIIVEVEDIPNIAGKNIIKVKSIEDLVDAQLELREPIYYKNDNDSCFFILLHFNEACIFVLRMNDSVVSPTEQSIRYMKEETVDKTKEQENILENLEKTVVYKLDELRSFKISPIRNNEKINVVDDTAIKKEIASSKDQEITSSALSSELSKTMYLKDLRERMLKYEEENLSKTKKLEKTYEEPKNEESSVNEEEVNPIERLKKIVKEKEQELTKELKITEEESKEEVIPETKETIKKEEPQVEIVEHTDTKNVSNEASEDDDDLFGGVVVLHSLDEDDEPVIEEIEDEEQEDEPFAPVVVDDLDEFEIVDDKRAEKEIKAPIIEEKPIIEEYTEEEEVESIEDILNAEENDSEDEPKEIIKENEEKNKTRRNPKPTRKVTHSTRRAQRHTNKTKR
ncbi:MAG TPA: hypothetical protein DCE23_05345 [Firmicutes bacterium]|nr:hypothetical protein [Bacillota bacterium]